MKGVMCLHVFGLLAPFSGCPSIAGGIGAAR